MHTWNRRLSVVACVLEDIIVGVEMVVAVRVRRSRSIKISHLSCSCTMNLNRGPSFVIKSLIIPGFPDEP
jgi:hypothetical protein